MYLNQYDFDPNFPLHKIQTIYNLVFNKHLKITHFKIDHVAIITVELDTEAENIWFDKFMTSDLYDAILTPPKDK